MKHGLGVGGVLDLCVRGIHNRAEVFSPGGRTMLSCFFEDHQGRVWPWFKPVTHSEGTAAAGSPLSMFLTAER